MVPASVQRLAFFAALLLAPTFLVQAQSTKHARVALLSRETAAVPGKELLVGVHFKLEPGWHIYWVNPGDSGQPPSFNWQLPAGWSAGEIRWPRPERMQNSPTLADYGYHDDVLLMVPMKVAAEQKPGQTVELRADAKWLVCREVCIPEKAQLALRIPIAKLTSNSTSAALFTAAQQKVPRPAPANWKIAAESRKDDFLLMVSTGTSVRTAAFFPLEASQIDNAARQRVQPSSTGFMMSLKKSDLLTKAVPKLRGVLMIPGRGAWIIEAPVTTQVALK